jgi:hypothetical protein
MSKQQKILYAKGNTCLGRPHKVCSDQRVIGLQRKSCFSHISIKCQALNAKYIRDAEKPVFKHSYR